MRDIKAHTGLRGIAAFTVFLGHAEFDRLWHGTFWLSGVYSFFYWQSPAVDMFFMLSGFVLNYVYLKERPADWRRYFSARFARICPLYYAGLLTMLAMNIGSVRLGHRPNSDLKSSVILPNLLMIQEWPAPHVVNSINIPSWSISVEVFLYIFIFPLLAFAVARRSLPKPLFLGILGVALLLNALVSRDLPHPLPIEYWGLIWGVTGFCAGFMICELVYNATEPLIPGLGEAALVAVVLAMLPFHSLHILLPAAFAALIAVTYPAASRLGRFLGSPIFFYLGGLSYSVYIWHKPVIKACSLAFAMRQMGASDFDIQVSSGRKLLYCVGTTVALLAVANISYYWFETPLRRVLRGPRRNGPRPGALADSAGSRGPINREGVRSGRNC
jgi:peptidoglycan/LPS O-acetylase OafA/YrhL